MEINKSNRYVGTNKLSLRTKTSLNWIKSENSDPDFPNINNDVDLFLYQIIEKSKKLKQTLKQYNINDQQQFCTKFLMKSICVKTLLKNIIQKMLTDRRLGSNLKGMNKSIMQQIEGLIWNSIIREIQLYKNGQQFQKNKKQIENILKNKKRQILQQLQTLNHKINNKINS